MLSRERKGEDRASVLSTLHYIISHFQFLLLLYKALFGFGMLKYDTLLFNAHTGESKGKATCIPDVQNHRRNVSCPSIVSFPFDPNGSSSVSHGTALPSTQTFRKVTKDPLVSLTNN